MSTIRRTFKVAWNDGDEVKVSTNGWDMVVASDQPNRAMMTFSLIHNALKRNGFEVPNLNSFIEQIDDMEDISDSDNANPTQALVPTDEQSP